MKFDLSKELDYKKAVSYVKKLFERKDKIEIKKFVGSRTLQQNKYFHVCATILSEYSGYTVDEIKIIIKSQLGFMHYQKGGHTFYVSSAELDKEQFMILVDVIRGFGQNHGCYIPSTEEYMESQFEIEREVKI